MDKPITSRIKSLLLLSGKSQTALAQYFGITPQSLYNKLTRGSFSADDLIKVADFTGAELAFTIGINKITLDSSCIRDKED